MHTQPPSSGAEKERLAVSEPMHEDIFWEVLERRLFRSSSERLYPWQVTH
jgi:hypothetical protein